MNILMKKSENFDDMLKSYLDSEEKKEFDTSLDSNNNLVITSKEEANYYIKKYKELIAIDNEAKAAAEKEIAKQTERINNWKDSVIESNQYVENMYLSALRIFAEKECEETNKKSIKLSYGNIGFRKQQDKYEYDKDRILESLQKYPELSDYIKTTYDVKVMDIKKDINVIFDEDLGIANGGKLNGHYIDGISVSKQPDKFEVK